MEAKIRITNQNRQKSQSGIIIILMAVLLVVFLALILLVVGTTYLATSKNRLQSAVNLAGFAAMEEFINRGGGANYRQNIIAARQRANRILAENRLPGVAGAMGDLRLSDTSADPNPPTEPGGVIEFGLWIRDYPGYPTSNCVVSPGEQCRCGSNPDDYPCFRANDNPVPPNNTFANAVRITANNQSGNPLIIPLARMWGNEAFQVSAQATVTLVQRCTSFLVDIGKSITAESHPLLGVVRSLAESPPGVSPRLQIIQPTSGYHIGLMALKRSETDIADSDPNFCLSMSPATMDQVIWCNLKRPTLLDRGLDTDPRRHYRSDYKTVSSPAGPLWINNYTRVGEGYFIGEPFSRYFLAFNAALRLLQTQASGGDLNVMTVFRGAIDPARDRWPANSGLTSDTGVLTQLTNVLNVGTSEGAPTRHPNFVDKLWVPLASSDFALSGNNLPLALVSAVSDLASCPAASRKSIILATDGIPSCSYPANFSTSTFGPSTCNYNWNTYQAAESQILNSILPELQRRRIAVTAIWQGRHIDANFVNRKIDGRFVDLSEAAGYGFGGVGSSQPIFNHDNFPASSPCPLSHADCSTPGTQCNGECTNNADRFAYFNNGLSFDVGGTETPVYFRRPNGVLGRLALETGGIACPLLPLCQDGSPDCGGSTCYEQDPDDPSGPWRLKPEHRVENAPQRCAIKRVSMTEQAADCALKTVGSAPYILVEEGA